MSGGVFDHDAIDRKIKETEKLTEAPDFWNDSENAQKVMNDLKYLKETYLLPGDYDFLMSSLSKVIESGLLLHDRVCLAPIEFGFKVYETPSQTTRLKDGPQLLGIFKFISGNSWLFKKVTKHKYKKSL